MEMGGREGERREGRGTNKGGEVKYRDGRENQM